MVGTVGNVAARSLEDVNEPSAVTEHPYYHPLPGTAWEAVDEAEDLLGAQAPLVTLANWQEDPHHAWSFQHMRELMPSQVIDGTDDPRPLAEATGEVGGIPLPETPWAPTVDSLLAATETDAFLVVHRGTIVQERYHAGMNRRRRHLLMSVTKSVVSAVAGSLTGSGLLDPDAPVETYVPELARCGYAGASVRTVLDMRSGVKFSEAYLDPDSEVRVMERSMGWAPRNHGDPLGMYPYILTTTAARPHDGVFDYRSIETDVLGWICERAAGRRMADLIADLVWRPIGAFHDAEIAADPLGCAVHDGGMSATLRDLGRFGLMLLDHGLVGERQVIPAGWVTDAAYPPADVRAAFAASTNEPYLPGGWYRSQFWFVPGDAGPILLCLGIHGQMVFVEWSTGLVGVKFSSWPTPQNADKLVATIGAFRAIGRTLC
jgi:CubicO group peptidase (beta-lactamase class C family)